MRAAIQVQIRIETIIMELLSMISQPARGAVLSRANIIIGVKNGMYETGMTQLAFGDTVAAMLIK